MKIKNALVIAADHLIQRFGNETKNLQLLEQFATEELELTPDQAKKFAEHAAKGQTTEWLNTEDDRNRFFTWYYINYVTKENICK